MKQRGFTLVELMTVVAIIGIIAAFGLGSIGQARARARDNQRVNDIKLIQNGLELYRTDIDKQASSGQLADALTYAYPLSYFGSADHKPTGPGIYDNPLFTKYLSVTPKEPQTKGKYVYFAPACIRPGHGTTLGTQNDPTVISPARDALFHTTKEIQNMASGDLCPKGSGWVPYAIFSILERPIAGSNQKSVVANLAVSDRAVVYSITQPIFVAGESNDTPGFSYIEDQSYCYPSPDQLKCPNGYFDEAAGTGGNDSGSGVGFTPIPSESPAIVVTPSPSPSTTLAPSSAPTAAALTGSDSIVSDPTPSTQPTNNSGNSSSMTPPSTNDYYP